MHEAGVLEAFGVVYICMYIYIYILFWLSRCEPVALSYKSGYIVLRLSFMEPGSRSLWDNDYADHLWALASDPTQVVASLNALFCGFKPISPILTVRGECPGVHPQLGQTPVCLNVEDGSPWTGAVTELRGDWKFFGETLLSISTQ